MSSWYDPPEDGPGFISGPDWWVTTYQHNERDEEIVCDFHSFKLHQVKDLAKEGYEVFIRYGYAWAMEEDADEWLFANSYEDAQGEIGDFLLEAKEAMAEAEMEAKYDRD
tara:strand:+ start:236 stop:565 length:330 start_codon:yes stop_codon:yes gene_type:complete